MDKNQLDEIMNLLDERDKKLEGERKAFLANKHTYLILGSVGVLTGTYYVLHELHLEVLAVMVEVSIASMMHILWGIWEESKKPKHNKKD